MNDNHKLFSRQNSLLIWLFILSGWLISVFPLRAEVPLSFHKKIVGQLVQDGRQTGYLLIHTPVQIVNSPFQNSIKTSVGFIGLVVLSQVDMPMKRSSQKYRSNQSLSDFFDFVNYFGDSRKIVLAVFSTYGAGLVLQRPNLRSIAIESFTAFTISGAFTTLIKHSTGRYRPFRDKGAYTFIGVNSDEFAEYSFPSGHSSNVFSIATVLAGHAPHKWQKGVLYSMASATSMARVYKNKHWLTDVTAGALLGYFTGRLVLKLNHTSAR